MSNAAKMDNQNSMSDGFNIASGIKWATLGLASFFVFGYVDNFFFDPLFFDAIHNPTNDTAQAFKAFLNDNFGWTHDLFGLTGDGGLLNMGWAQDILKPYYDLTATPQSYEFGSDADLFSSDFDSPDW